MPETSPTLVGRKRIAHELGVSERTASRWRRLGLIPVEQKAGRTSQWRVAAKDLEKSQSAPFEGR